LPGKLSHIESALKNRHEDGKFRSLYDVESIEPPYVVVTGKKLLNLCSNDYLSLSNHPELINTSGKFLEKYGTGSKASRLVSGTHHYHSEVEKALSDWLKRESVLLFNSGFQLNSTLIPAISRKSTILYYDKRNHNSLVTGALGSEAKLLRYRHLDYGHLEELLKKNAKNASENIIVSESVFSMDGDIADIEALCRLAKKYDATLIIDEAHAIGVMGENGRGLCYDNEDVDMVIGTFGKAFGSFGAFVACNQTMREFLINFCSGFIYSTSLPPSVVGSILAALKVLPGLQDDRNFVNNLGSWLRNQLAGLSVDTSGSNSHIIPIVTGSEQSALELSDLLRDEGYLAMAIRPPTVEPGRSRIRITLNSSISKEHLNRFLEVIQKYVSSKDD
jgi:8-amino-7-oxononanoate synthase